MRRGQALAEIVLKLQIVSPQCSGGHVCRGRTVVSGSPRGRDKEEDGSHGSILPLCVECQAQPLPFITKVTSHF